MEIVSWYFGGYRGINLTKEIMKEKKYSFKEIKKVDSTILEQIEENLENDGVIFCLIKKNIIKAVYFLKVKKSSKEKILVFDKKVILDEASKYIKGFEKDIGSVLGNTIEDRVDIDKAIWKEKEIKKSETFISAVKLLKALAWFLIIISCVVILAYTISSTSYYLSISNSSFEEIKNDELLLDYVSNLNDYSYSETIDVFSRGLTKTDITVFEIIIPTIFILFGYIFLIIALKKLLDLLKGITDSQELFTVEKYKMLKEISLYIFIATLVLLNNFILWFTIVTLIEITLYIFKKYVIAKNLKKS